MIEGWQSFIEVEPASVAELAAALFSLFSLKKALVIEKREFLAVASLIPRCFGTPSVDMTDLSVIGRLARYKGKILSDYSRYCRTERLKPLSVYQFISAANN